MSLRPGALAAPLIFSLLCVFALAACGGASSSSSAGSGNSNVVKVNLTSDNFATNSATLKTGQTLEFVDPADTGGTHILCLGKNGKCAANAQGPSALQGQGFSINAGDPPKDVAFDTTGAYQITCTLHPNMNLTVTVQ